MDRIVRTQGICVVTNHYWNSLKQAQPSTHKSNVYHEADLSVLYNTNTPPNLSVLGMTGCIMTCHNSACSSSLYVKYRDGMFSFTVLIISD